MHSTPIKRYSRPSLQVVDHHRNLATTEIRQHPGNVAGIRRQNPAIVVGIRSAQISGTVFRSSSRIWLEHPGQIGRTDQARTAGFWPVCRNPVIFRWNPANPNSDETVRIPAFILDSGYSSRNDEIR
jgi:hypothetical protein